MGSVKKSSFVIIWLFWQGQKHGAVQDIKVSMMKLKFYCDSGCRSRTGDFNCIDNYKYYYSILEKRKSKKIRENKRKWAKKRE